MFWRFLVIVWIVGAAVTYHTSSKAVERIKNNCPGPIWLLYTVHMGVALLWPVYWIKVSIKVYKLKRKERE